MQCGNTGANQHFNARLLRNSYHIEKRSVVKQNRWSGALESQPFMPETKSLNWLVLFHEYVCAINWSLAINLRTMIDVTPESGVRLKNKFSNNFNKSYNRTQAIATSPQVIITKQLTTSVGSFQGFLSCGLILLIIVCALAQEN